MQQGVIRCRVMVGMMLAVCLLFCGKVTVVWGNTTGNGYTAAYETSPDYRTVDGTVRIHKTVVAPHDGYVRWAADAQGFICPAEKTIHIAAFGDSLISGYGLPDQLFAFPNMLQRVLRELGYAVVVTNNGVAGETTVEGLARLPKVLSMKPDILILELGANDMLQHLSVVKMRENLAAMIEMVQAKDVALLFAGMESVPHYGAEYADAFDAVFPDLAVRYDVLFYPFFLEGVALDHSLNQQDGKHPNAFGVEVIVRNMLPYVVSLIKVVCTP
ncbi:MAG: arylesterase [Desulfovibrionales bacterium]|nr:arylesterase [Desulfovibrionales bacterium]